MSTTAAEVIQQHAALTDRWRWPNVMLTDYVSSFAGDVTRNRGAISASQMFYPLRTTRISEPWVTLVGKELFSSSTYQITGEMCNVITDLYRKSAGSDTTISVSELPSERGFTWLDAPPEMRDRRGKIALFRAVSWSLITVPFEIDDQEPADTPSIRVILWADTQVRDDYSSRWAPVVLQKSERAIGRLQLQHTVIVPLDQRVCAERSSGDAEIDDTFAWIHTMFMMMGTVVAARKRGVIPRSVTGNVKKRVKHGDVTVITLRRATQGDGTSGEHAEVDWSCRWVVQGHHRHLESYDITEHRAVPLVQNQKRCAVCNGRITWIPPHVKGPDGAPLKAMPTVHRLSR